VWILFSLILTTIKFKISFNSKVKYQNQAEKEIHRRYAEDAMKHYY